jgi:hypothetical protein
MGSWFVTKSQVLRLQNLKAEHHGILVVEADWTNESAI